MKKFVKIIVGASLGVAFSAVVEAQDEIEAPPDSINVETIDESPPAIAEEAPAPVESLPLTIESPPTSEYDPSPALELADPMASADIAPAVEPEIGASLGSSERRTSLARGLLASYQAAHGAAIGVEFCYAFDCDKTMPQVLLPMIGAGAGLTTSLMLTRHRGITMGQALAINAGTSWGAFNGLGWAGAFNYFEDQSRDPTPLMWAMIGSQLLGTAGGALAAYFWEPTTGQVTTTMSVARWAALTTTFFMLAGGDADLRGSGSAMVLLMAGNAGLAGGGLLARFAPMSAGRSLLVDGGAGLGTLFGISLALAVQGEHWSNEFLFGAAGAGALVGWGLTYFLTRRLDLPDPPVTAEFAPTPGGAIANFRLSL